MKKTSLLGIAILALLPLAVPAQNGPTCTVTVDNTNASCSEIEWIPNYTACEHAWVSCLPFNKVSFSDLGIRFAYKNPSGTSNGTVVFFSEGGGETTNSRDPVGTSKAYAEYYNNATNNYQVVQTAWDSDWEDTGTGNTKNIAYAAGRPTAFLLWAYNNLFLPSTRKSTAGMCAQGASAGGAAVMYALSWYGLYSTIDKVSLLSSPPLSDIQQGCEVNAGANPLPTAVTVCPTGQLGCNGENTPASWVQEPVYSGSALTSVITWTGLSSCQGGQVTDASDNATWKGMSIVDGTYGTFNFPKTNITAWLCSGVSSDDGTMNNSSPEAQLFFGQFTNSSQYNGLTINGIPDCESSEQVGPGTPPDNYQDLGYNTGMAAIEYDMVTDPVNACVAHNTH